MAKKTNPRADTIQMYVKDRIFVDGIDPKFLKPPANIEKDPEYLRSLLEELDTVPNPPSKFVGPVIHKFSGTDEWKFGFIDKENKNHVAVQLLPPSGTVSEYRQVVRWPVMNVEFVDNLSGCMATDERSFFKMVPVDYDVSPKLHELGSKCLSMRRFPFEVMEDGLTPSDHFFMGQKDKQSWLVEKQYVPSENMTADDIKSERAKDAAIETDHKEKCKQNKNYTDCPGIHYRSKRPSEEIRLDPFKGSNRSSPAANEKFSRKYLQAMAHPQYDDLNDANEDFFYRSLPDLQGKTWFNPIMAFHPMDMDRPLSLIQLEQLKGKKCVGIVYEFVGGMGGCFPINNGIRPNNLTSFRAMIIMPIGIESSNISSNSLLAQAYSDSPPPKPKSVLEKLYSETDREKRDSDSDDEQTTKKHRTN